jgi:hypothetical protein
LGEIAACAFNCSRAYVESLSRSRSRRSSYSNDTTSCRFERRPSQHVKGNITSHAPRRGLSKASQGAPCHPGFALSLFQHLGQGSGRRLTATSDRAGDGHERSRRNGPTDILPEDLPCLLERSPTNPLWSKQSASGSPDPPRPSGQATQYAAACHRRGHTRSHLARHLRGNFCCASRCAEPLPLLHRGSAQHRFRCRKSRGANPSA